MIHTSSSRGCARILDPVALNRAVRHGFGGLDPGSSLFVFIVALFFTVGWGFVWWQYDLLSTWTFSQGIRAETAPTVATLQAASDRYGVAALVGGLTVVAFTLLPSLVELLAPRIIHPGVQLALNVSVWFDFVTDWPTAAAAVNRWQALDSLGPARWLGEAVATAIATLCISLLVQVLVILGVTALIVCALNIVGYGGRAAAAVQIIEGP